MTRTGYRRLYLVDTWGYLGNKKVLEAKPVLLRAIYFTATTFQIDTQNFLTTRISNSVPNFGKISL